MKFFVDKSIWNKMRNFQDKYLGLSKLIMNFWLPQPLFTQLVFYFWSGAGAGFFHAPTHGGEHWSGAVKFFGSRGPKGVCSRSNGAYPSLVG